jgi:energy-coupling factor transporter ATP-binding protein EcfA2
MIKYDLHLLGWHAFQQLCLNICREILGQTVTSFLDTNDAGKDGAFSGKWVQKDGEDLKGNFVIQCKFTNRQGHNLILSELADEFKKIEKLVKDGRCDCYVLITNAGITGKFEGQFYKKLGSLGVKTYRVFGSTWIFDQISENKRLRLFVPRVYGLGDLSQILDERAYSQAKQLLTSMWDDLSKVVMTSAYHKAAKALSDHGFVLIIGEAAAGKTTIASLLAIAAVDQWGLSTLKLDNPDQVMKHWNPDDPNQFYWIDDVFGVTQYESGLVSNWNHILVQVRSMLKQGIKIVMTSRDYIYSRARVDLKDGAFPLFNESQVVIDVHKLKQEEKEQILYNHLKLGHQPLSFIKEVKPFLPAIALHKRFIPETARRLAEPAFTKGLYMWEHSLLEFVNRQESFLEEVLHSLDKHSKASLALIYMNGGQLPSPVVLAKEELNAVSRQGSDPGSCLAALEAMNNSLVQYAFIDDNAIWRFKHPTIGDAYAKIVAKSPEQLEIYLQGTPIEKILDQVTCGNVGLENAVVVPKTMFSVLQERMVEYKRSDRFKDSYMSGWDAKRKVFTFLARRSSKEFLKLYLNKNPELFGQILKPTMSFYFSDEIELVTKLNEVGLLPEEHRKTFVDYIAHFTITGDDLYLLKNEELQGVFTEAEMQEVKEKVKLDLLPKLNEVRWKREGEFRESNRDTPEEHMEEFLEKMKILLNEFEEEVPIVKKVEEEISKAKQWVEENNFEEPESRPDRVLDTSEAPVTTTTTRSIFDDVDQVRDS